MVTIILHLGVDVKKGILDKKMVASSAQAWAKQEVMGIMWVPLPTGTTVLHFSPSHVNIAAPPPLSPP